MVRMRILDVARHKTDENTFHIVLLVTEDQSRMLPIFIGRHEAEVIALGAGKRELPRPLTMDLMLNLLEAAGASVAEVQVESLRESTFYAAIKLRIGDAEKVVDARPSDAIALALRTNSPIYASEAVLNRAGVAIRDEDRKGKKTLRGIDDLAKTIDEAIKAKAGPFVGFTLAELHIESLLSD